MLAAERVHVVADVGVFDFGLGWVHVGHLRGHYVFWGVRFVVWVQRWGAVVRVSVSVVVQGLDSGAHWILLGV